MNISSTIAALVVIATISTIAFVGISENTEAFSSEEKETVEISAHDTISFSDSVIVSVSSNTNNSSG